MQSQKFTFGKFRINDVSATDDNIELRRKVPVENFGQRATYVNEKTLPYRYMVSLDIHTLAGYPSAPPTPHISCYGEREITCTGTLHSCHPHPFQKAGVGLVHH